MAYVNYQQVVERLIALAASKTNHGQRDLLTAIGRFMQEATVEEDAYRDFLAVFGEEVQDAVLNLLPREQAVTSSDDAVAGCDPRRWSPVDGPQRARRSMQHTTADAYQGPRPDVEDDSPEVTGAGLIERAASGAKLTETETIDALDWFLSAEESDLTKTVRLNVGGAVDEDGNAINPADPRRWIEWTIRPLDLDTIKRIRRRLPR